MTATKRCSRCKKQKSTGDFYHRYDRGAKNLMSHCKDCERIRCVVKNAVRVEKHKTRVTAIKLDRGCVDCGFRGHPEALQFDHVRGEKVEGISRMANTPGAWRHIEAEIAKCEVRCANCHAIKTAERRAA